MATPEAIKKSLKEQYGIRLNDDAVADFLEETKDVAEIRKQVFSRTTPDRPPSGNGC